jgi:AcrR family transcriptional regulator
MVALGAEIDRPPPLARAKRVAEAVAAARRLVEEEGPGALTMRRLADQLGIRAPSLYKHFPNKAALEAAIITDGLFEMGEVSHRALRPNGRETPLMNLLIAYRRYCCAHPNLYRLATAGPLARGDLPPGLEEWAGNPWYVVTGDPSLAQALWSFAHGMVILELDERYPPGSDLDSTWRAGAAAFEWRARQ